MRLASENPTPLARSRLVIHGDGDAGDYLVDELCVNLAHAFDESLQGHAPNLEEVGCRTSVTG